MDRSSFMDVIHKLGSDSWDIMVGFFLKFNPKHTTAFLVNDTFSATHKIDDPDSNYVPTNYWKVNPKEC